MMRKVLAGVGLASCCAIVTLAGCNGNDNNGGINPQVIPTATSTATPTATAVAQSFSSPVVFGNGQSGTLALQVQGGRATGTLRVNTAVPRLTAAAITFAIPTGLYSVSGTFSAPRAFSVSGSFPAPIGNFSIRGTIPTLTQSGAFTLRATGQSTSGVIPIEGTLPTPQPTVVGTPSATPVAVPGSTVPAT